MASTPPTRVAAVDRALQLLETLASAGRPLGVSELARRCALPKSTVVRLLATLESHEAVERPAGSSGYRLGDGLARLTSGRDATARVRAAARGHLRALADEAGEDVALAVADGERMLFVEQASCQHPVQVPDWSGQRLPYHAAAAGFVLLAGRDEAAVESWLEGGLPAWGPRTVTDPDEVRRRVARARRAGLVWVHEEWAQGISGIAAAVPGADGRVIAAVNCFGPSYRFPGERDPGEIERQVLRTADRIASGLDGR